MTYNVALNSFVTCRSYSIFTVCFLSFIIGTKVFWNSFCWIYRRRENHYRL
jgi:hypothetical protein